MSREGSPYQMFASGLFFGSLLTLGILMTIPQEDADYMTYLGLAAGVTLMVVSFFSFAGIALRRLFRIQVSQDTIKTAIRQSIELLLLGAGLFTLHMLEVLSWWGGILLVVAMIFIEFLIMAKKYTFHSKI